MRSMVEGLAAPRGGAPPPRGGPPPPPPPARRAVPLPIACGDRED
jgi:hypothetical protein